MTKLNNWDDEHSEELFIEGIKLARTFRKDKLNEEIESDILQCKSIANMVVNNYEEKIEEKDFANILFNSNNSLNMYNNFWPYGMEILSRIVIILRKKIENNCKLPLDYIINNININDNNIDVDGDYISRKSGDLIPLPITLENEELPESLLKYIHMMNEYKSDIMLILNTLNIEEAYISEDRYLVININGLEAKTNITEEDLIQQYRQRCSNYKEDNNEY